MLLLTSTKKHSFPCTFFAHSKKRSQNTIEINKQILRDCIKFSLPVKHMHEFGTSVAERALVCIVACMRRESTQQCCSSRIIFVLAMYLPNDDRHLGDTGGRKFILVSEKCLHAMKNDARHFQTYSSEDMRMC